VQKELDNQSSKLETFQAQLASKTLLSDKELGAQALVEVEAARQRDSSAPGNKYNLLLSKSDFLFLLFLTLHLV